jgi:hypothetical protein
MSSIFMEKSSMPSERDLQEALGDRSTWWTELRAYTLDAYPKATEEWNFPGAKYGWSFRIKDKKRAILYFLPGNNQFRVALVFGEKATNQALQSNISKEIKDTILAAPVYTEGRGFRIEVSGKEIIEDIKTLIDIKLAN